MRTYFGLYVLLLVLVIEILLVNPLREILTADDSWAYALSVRHLVETGEYKLHDWASVNMPVQIYLAGFLAKTFGYSFTLLRLSTLSLLFVAVISFYYLLRDFGTGDVEAALLSAAVVSSPVIFFLSFTFQTDIQFIAWELLALWLYTRALRDESYPLMALGSLAAAAAIGTRQFGVALVVGLFVTWLLLEQGRARKIAFYGLGLALPLFMMIWQVAVGAHRPTFSQRLTLNEQWLYIRNWTVFAEEVFSRPAVSLQYLGLFLLPLLPLGAALVHQQWKRREVPLNRWWYWLLIVCAIYIAAGICFRFYYFHAKPTLIPYLDWLLRDNGALDRLFPLSNKFRLVITLLSYALAVILAWLLLDRYLLQQRANPVSRCEWFILGCALTA